MEETMTTRSTPRNTPIRRHRITAAATLLLAAGALALAAPANAVHPGPPTPPPPRGADYVAIAFSPENGAHGWENNQGLLSVADNDAVANCQHFGGSQCRIVVTARNQCAALYASTPDQNGQSNGYKWGPPHVGTGPTPYAAEQAAVDPGGVPVDDTGLPLIIRCATGDAGQG
jgi:hypothetical protein